MTIQQMLDDRYGRRHIRHGRVWGWIGGIVGTVVVIGIAFLMVYGNPTSVVNSQVTSTTVPSARTVSLTFQLNAPPHSRVACALEADDSENGIVGWRVLEFKPVPEQQRTYTETIPTLARSTGGLVNTCWVI